MNHVTKPPCVLLRNFVFLPRFFIFVSKTGAQIWLSLLTEGRFGGIIINDLPLDYDQ